MAHLLLEDVTLRKEDRVIAEIRFKGGALKTLELPLPLPFSVLSRTRPEVVEAIDELLAAHDYQEIVDILRIPIGTVKSRINRGRIELAKIMRRMKVVETF